MASRTSGPEASGLSTAQPQPQPHERPSAIEPYFSRTIVRTSLIWVMTNLLDGRSELREQGFESFHDVRNDAVADARAVDLAADQARFLEHLEVLGHGGLRERQALDDGPADALATRHQHAHDRDAGRVPERLGETRGVLVGAGDARPRHRVKLAP